VKLQGVGLTDCEGHIFSPVPGLFASFIEDSTIGNFDTKSVGARRYSGWRGHKTMRRQEFQWREAEPRRVRAEGKGLASVSADLQNRRGEVTK